MPQRSVFIPAKNLGAYGEGGALTTNDDAVAQFAREMRSHGEAKRYFHDRIGYNYRMDGFQGAVLNVKLKYLDRWTAKRQEFAKLYRERLAGSQYSDSRQTDPECESVYHLFTPWVQNRDAVREELCTQRSANRGALSGAGSSPKGLLASGIQTGSLPHTETACAEVLSMPLFPEMSREQVVYAAETLADVVTSIP